MRRVFQFDVLRCISCGGRMRVIAFIEDGHVSTRILEHLGLTARVPAVRPARAPPPPPPGSDAKLVFHGLDECPDPFWINSDPGADPGADRDPEPDPDYPVE